MKPAAQTAVGACDDIMTTDQIGKAHDSFRDELRMFDDVGSVADYPRDKDFAIGKFYTFPYAPFVLVTRIGGLNQIRPGVYLQQHADDILERQIRRVRSVPSPP